ncbi:MAG: hypothetical protein ACI8WB_002326 [Phenylobacterium sp.]|jgi:hypothetical protein
MKTFILFFTGLLLSNNALANTINAVENVYINKIRVHYGKNNQTTTKNILSVYLNKNDKQPSYQHKLLMDQHMDDATVYNDKLFIMLDSSDNYHFLILDKKTGKVIDNVWGLFPALSPSGRFIVYQAHQFRNETSQYGKPVGVTMIYDLAKDPIENRTLAKQQQLKRTPVSLKSSFERAGIPVYPPGDTNKPSYGWSTERSKRVSVFGEYHWYQDDAFIFAMYPKQGMTKIANAIYNQQSNKFDIKTYQLTNKAFALGLESDSKTSGIAIKRIETTGQQIKLYTNNAIIRLDSLEQLPLLE